MFDDFKAIGYNYNSDTQTLEYRSEEEYDLPIDAAFDTWCYSESLKDSMYHKNVNDSLTDSNI